MRSRRYATGSSSLFESYAPAFLAAALALLAFTSCSRQADQVEDQAPVVDTVEGPAGALHIDDGGTGGGVPVVFVHSFAGSSEHWKAQLEHLRPHRRAIAIDLRAHGRSAVPNSPDYSVEAFASDIEAAVDALGLERFVLVGHSLGGAAALDYAAGHPDRVVGLVLVSAPGKLPAEQAEEIERAMNADYATVSGQYWDRLLTDATPATRGVVQTGMNGLPQPVALTIIHELLHHDPLPAVERYPGPKLAIVTTNDDQPQALHKTAAGISHVVVTGTSHWLHMDKPDDFNRALDEFLSRAV